MADILDRLHDFTHGSLASYHDGQGYRLTRMTERQFAHFGAAEGSDIRAHCCAGMVLCLLTDSKSLELEGDILRGARLYFGLDVEIDGQPCGVVRDEERTGHFRLPLFEEEVRPPEPRVVKIYLPHSTEVRLTAVHLEAGAVVQPEPPPARKLLCLGDSITQGMNAVSPLAIYPQQVARHFDAELLNQGVGGHVFDLEALDPDLPFQPDLVTVAYGTNDWSRGLTRDEVQAVATQYLSTIHATWPEARIYAWSPLWRQIGHEERAGGTLIEFGQAIREAADRVSGVTVFDGCELIPHDVCYMPDGCHPNEAGFLHYALNLCRLMRQE